MSYRVATARTARIASGCVSGREQYRLTVKRSPDGFGGDPTAAKDDDPISHPDYFLRVVANEDNRDPLSRQVGDDPMDFDYRMRQGVTEETNALAIARMAGVPV